MHKTEKKVNDEVQMRKIQKKLFTTCLNEQKKFELLIVWNTYFKRGLLGGTTPWFVGLKKVSVELHWTEKRL